ncbi:RidA family protein [Pseudomonas sp. Fl4BN1]|uniref:RidA family protein n=1 Tax=Pseudomonas sp. Fl4BN1 TaxID=2697651 RepID=UPI00137653E0|nr:RidA family protein [Pseudomonas sp. Fl4BN1]NBF09179.1 hypothetical protein [Pseudomonas sp. Fl4BN1]
MNLVETEDLILCNWQEATLDGPLEQQFEALLEGMQDALRPYGVPFSAMLKHSIAIRNAVVDPLAAIQAFHRQCHALAPQLQTEPSVGTIFRLPRFAREATLVAVEAVFAKHPEGIRRVLFDDMPMDVARALEYRGQLFLTGFEALELAQVTQGFTADNLRVRDSLEEQVEVVLDKIQHSLRALGTDCSALSRLTLYLRDDQDPEQARRVVVAAALRRASRGLAADFQLFVLRGHGMVLDRFKIEIDGLALAADASRPGWISLCCGHGGVLELATVEEAATALAERLAAYPPQAPRALQILLKSTHGNLCAQTIEHLLAAFEARLRQLLGRRAPAQLSPALLCVKALLEPEAALELDASLFIQ